MSKNKNTGNTLSTLGVFSSSIKEIIVENSYAKIHSVFPNGFNLNFEDGLVYVSGHQEGMLSARGLSINREVFDALIPYLKTGVHVRVRKDQWMFYTRPQIFTVYLTDKLEKNLRVVPVTIEELNAVHFLKQLEAMDVFDQSGFQANDLLREMFVEIHKGKEVTMHHVKRLIGAGVGLTPTGDDFLQGLILMEQTLNHLPHLQTIVTEQLKKRSTTDVSLSYYEALFEGYSNEPLVLLFQAIKTKNKKDFKQALSYIQAYGSTSGYDLLMGIKTYLEII